VPKSRNQFKTGDSVSVSPVIDFQTQFSLVKMSQCDVSQMLIVALKWIGYLICISIFVFQVLVVWTQYQVSISQSFYEQLMRAKIPKAQKKQSSHQCLFSLLGSSQEKAVHKKLMKLTPERGHCHEYLIR